MVIEVERPALIDGTLRGVGSGDEHRAGVFVLLAKSIIVDIAVVQRQTGIALD